MIAEFSYLYQAHIARANLEVAGIDCFIEDQYSVNNIPISYSVNWVRLFVNEEDVEVALQIINSDFPNDVDIEFSDNETRQCPNCQNYTAKSCKKRKWPVILTIILLGIPLFFIEAVISAKVVVCLLPMHKWQKQALTLR